MHGGMSPAHDGRKQEAVIDFICVGADGEGKGDEGKEDDGLGFVSYGAAEEEEETDVLKLEWRTRRACEGDMRRGEKGKGGHWGFFTWFILM